MINIRPPRRPSRTPDPLRAAWGLLHGDSTSAAKSTLRNLITPPLTSPSPAARAIRSTASSAPSPPATASLHQRGLQVHPLPPHDGKQTTNRRQRHRTWERWRPRSTARPTTLLANPWSSSHVSTATHPQGDKGVTVADLQLLAKTGLSPSPRSARSHHDGSAERQERPPDFHHRLLLEALKDNPNQ